MSNLQLNNIELDRITPSPYQGRKSFGNLEDLARSIADVGLINPITVRAKDGHYELVAGERRLRAARLIPLETIPALVRVLTDSEARRVVLAENARRLDLSPVEEAGQFLEHLDAELWQDPAYRTCGAAQAFPDEFDHTAARQRARWLLVKLDSDRRNDTDIFTNKFIGKVEAIFTNHPRGTKWQSFLNNDVPMLDLPAMVQEFATELRLNKSQTKALGKVFEQDDKAAQKIMETGTVTIVENFEFKTVPVEEASAREINKAPVMSLREERATRLIDPVPMPSHKYRILYADPPWHYAQVIEKYGPAERHYPTMILDEICAMKDDIAERTADDAVLFLWSTAPKLKDALQVAEAWGFRYTGAMFVWDKVRHNYGHYNSVRHELLLICGKGSCTPDASKLVDSVQTIERSDEHSEKPEEFRKIIDKLYTKGRRIELFWRGDAAPDNWDVWGSDGVISQQEGDYAVGVHARPDSAKPDRVWHPQRGE